MTAQNTNPVPCDTCAAVSFIHQQAKARGAECLNDLTALKEVLTAGIRKEDEPPVLQSAMRMSGNNIYKTKLFFAQMQSLGGVICDVSDQPELRCATIVLVTHPHNLEARPEKWWELVSDTKVLWFIYISDSVKATACINR